MSDPSMTDGSAVRTARRTQPADALDRIATALHNLQFGEVRVIVQDGSVVQVERTEKLRLRTRGEQT